MRKNQIAAIKAAQAIEAEKTGVNPYASGKAPVKTASVNKLLAHYQAAMGADLASLKALKTLPEKQAAKAVMLEKYQSFIHDYLALEHNYPNDVAVQCMIWLIDTGDIEQGLEFALHLITQDQIMPPRFDRRDIETFLCDALYDWANDLLKKQQSASPYLDTLARHLIDDAWPVHPAVASKTYVMLAKHKAQAEDWQACFSLCEQAERVNPEGAGVKTLKAQAFAKINQTGNQS